MNVGIVGIGKVGSCMLACFTKHGHNVLGYDIRDNPLKYISRTEKSLKELIREYNLEKRITSLENLVCHSELIFIIVQTPSLPNGCFDTKYVENALKSIARIDDSKICIVNSTVPPGSMRKFNEIMENLYYNPLYIRMGSVIEDLEKIKFIMVGSKDGSRNSKIEHFWHSISSARIFWDKYETVEITKLALNCIMTSQISLINKFNEIFEKSNADIRYLLRILKLDERFKFSNYRPGLGYGGPCLPRDNRMMKYYCETKRINPAIFEVIDEINKETLDFIVDKYSRYNKIGIYGLGYKINSDIITDSQPLELVEKFRKKGKIVETYDPNLPELSTVQNERELAQKTEIVLLCFPYKTNIECEKIWKE